MPIFLAGCVDPVLIYSFLGGIVVSILAGLVSLFRKFKNPRNQVTAAWISIAGGAVVFFIAGGDGAFHSSAGLVFCIPLGIGIVSLCRSLPPQKLVSPPDKQPRKAASPLETVTEGIAQLIQSLERIPHEPPSSNWIPPVLAFARELQGLAAEHPLDAVRIRNLSLHLRQHTKNCDNRFQAQDDLAGHAKALERLAEQEKP